MKMNEGITVKIEREDRLIAINNLSMAILEVAKSLNTAPRVNIENCEMHTVDTAIKIEGFEKKYDIEKIANNLNETIYKDCENTVKNDTDKA